MVGLDTMRSNCMTKFLIEFSPLLKLMTMQQVEDEDETAGKGKVATTMDHQVEWIR